MAILSSINLQITGRDENVPTIINNQLSNEIPSFADWNKLNAPTQSLTPNFKNAQQKVIDTSRSEDLGRTPKSKALLRSNTFVISRHAEPVQNESLLVNEFYGVKRRSRARTPVAFNVMLDDPKASVKFDENGFSESVPVDSQHETMLSSAPKNPKINYSLKNKARIIIGKQGRENCAFIWPIDVAINQFNNQIMISDSGNHRIQIFNSDGKFLKSFGISGIGNGQFNSVSGLFIDAMSNIFTVDRLNNRK